MKVYVLGLGHIGLPLAVFLALKGFEVTGIDKNEKVIKDIEENEVKIYEKYQGKHISELAFTLIQEKRLTVCTFIRREEKMPAVFLVTVGVADDGKGNYDIGPLIQVMHDLEGFLIKGDLLIFKTTMIPGTCEKLILPWVKNLGFKVYMAYCPETIAEGSAFEELENNPRILAAADEESYQKAAYFLNLAANTPIYRASNIRVAETAKVVQNIFRDVNIALANELTNAAKALKIDNGELRYLVNTHPRVNLLEAGPGVGGYCLPNAWGYLKEALNLSEQKKMRLISLARSINEERPHYVAAVVRKALTEVGRNIEGAKVAIAGLAMKDYCADIRCSPAVEIAYILQKWGAKVKAYDPLVQDGFDYQVKSMEECIYQADCLVIAAKQERMIFDIKIITELMNKPPLVVDTRNIFPEGSDVILYKV